MNTMFKYLILGGGTVAGYAAQEMVKLGQQPGDLGIISSDSVLPYHRPHLSKQAFISGKMHADMMLINPPEFYTSNGIAVHLDTLATGVDWTQRRVLTAENTAVEYEQLLIATGCSSRVLNLPGKDLSGVCYLRSINDGRRIRDLASKSRRAVCVGAGFIGLEVASALASRGIETSIAYRDDRVMANLFTPEISAFFERYYAARGVKLLPGTGVSGLAGTDRLNAVVTSTGEEIPADIVVMGVGAVPATEIFEGSSLQIERRAIVVNEYLETNIPGVLAAGDVTSYYDVIFGRHRHVEHWDTAVAQGKHAARIFMGAREPYDRLSYFFSRMFDLSWEFWGDTQGANQVVNRGTIEDGRFSTWWLRDDVPVAVLMMRRPREERQAAQRWIRNGEPISPALLADDSQPLVVSA